MVRSFLLLSAAPGLLTTADRVAEADPESWLWAGAAFVLGVAATALWMRASGGLWRRSARARHSDQERLLKALLIARMDAFEWDLKSDRVVRDGNAKASSGFPSHTLGATGREYFSFVHPGDRQRLRQCIECLSPKRPEFSLEYRLMPPEGSPRWMQDFARGEFDESGTLMRLRGMTMDITERKASEEELRLSQQRLRFVLRSSGVGLWELDLASGQVRTSAEHRRSLGLQPGEEFASLDQILRHVHPEDQSLRENAVAAARENDGDYSAEYRVIWPDGSVHWLLSRGRVLAPQPGEQEGFMGITLDITERKEIEERLRESEERVRRQFAELEAIYHTAPLGLCVIDRSLRFVRINERLADSNGASVAAHLGRTVAEVLPALAEQAEAALQKVLRSGQLERVEISGQTPARPGVHRIWDESWYPLRDSSGEIVGVGVVAEEITERRRIEETLRRERERLALALHAGGMGVYELDFSTERLWWSPELFVVFGLKPESFSPTRENFMALVAPEDREDLRAKIAEALLGKRIFSAEFRIVRPDGQRRWLSDRAEIEYDQEGQAQRQFGVSIDVTERKAAELALEDNEARFRAVANNIPQLAWMTDAHGSITWFNQRWFDYTGVTFEQMRGPGWATVQHPDHHQRVETSWKTALLSGHPWEDTFPLRAADGAYRWFLSRAFPIRDAQNRITHWFGTNTDITELREAEAALRATTAEAENARRQAEEASRAKDDFLAALSHELRTPLTPVLMTVAALESEQALPLEVREQLAMMRRNIELEARLIDDLLDLTRVSLGKIQLHPVPADAHTLLRHTLEITRADTVGKDLCVELRLEAAHFHVHADPARLQQVFWNLLKNAFKFTGPGGRIALRTLNPAPGKLLVSVEDTGIGISQAGLDRIFERFDQGDLAGRHRFGGLGLGLSISKAIVDLHGGQLRAQSAGLNRGATFTVELATISDPPAQNASPTHSGPRHSASLRLLVIEDDANTLSVLVRLLERDGHRVLPASTVAEALSLCTHCECDAVISDLGLPDGTGHELMEEIRRHHDWPAIALSGYGMEEDLRRSNEAGFQFHLVKPVDYAQLRQLLNGLP